MQHVDKRAQQQAVRVLPCFYITATRVNRVSCGARHARRHLHLTECTEFALGRKLLAASAQSTEGACSYVAQTRCFGCGSGVYRCCQQCRSAVYTLTAVHNVSIRSWLTLTVDAVASPDTCRLYRMSIAPSYALVRCRVAADWRAHCATLCVPSGSPAA
jgi:hypothetical protein